jgi:hypothetical protein
MKTVAFNDEMPSGLVEVYRCVPLPLPISTLMLEITLSSFKITVHLHQPTWN